MRTTLDVDDDVLAVVEEIARRERLSAGEVVSRLARFALTSRIDQQPSGRSVAGFRPFTGGFLVSNELVNTLRYTEGV